MMDVLIDDDAVLSFEPGMKMLNILLGWQSTLGPVVRG
jgi:hypothetical protein